MTSFRIRKKDERALLKDVFIFIRDLDPDLICGTELRTVYLPYLQKRCAIHGIEPTLGRGEGLLRQQTSSLFRESHEIPGRTIVDLMDVVLHPELLALYGFFRRAGGYDLSPSDPILSTIRSILEREPAERVKVMDQMIEEVARTIIPIMRQTPLTPTLILQTNASTRTEATTIGRSISVHSSLPEAGPSTHTPAVHEAPYQTGVFSTVLELILSPVSVSAFARSSGNAEAADDQTAVPGLSSLQQEAASSAAGGFADLSPGRFDVLHGAVQSSLSRQSRFYLASFAPELVRLQQEVIDEAERALGLHNILVLQQTDDTLICQIPDNARASLTAFLGKVQQDLPYGLRAIVLDTFDVCVSLGPRLFALRTGNRIVSHRRARIPRFFEPFLKEFFSRSLECCLHNDWTGLRRTYIQTLRSIQRHSWHVLDFARQETLAESLEHYDTLVKAGKRNPSAAYESIRTTNPEARAGTTVRYYITGIRKEVTQAEHCKLSDEWDSADPDENTEYYMDRLAQCVERFRILFDVNGFSRIFGGEDLFGFDPDQIHTVQRSSGLSDEARSTREDDRTISLDLGDPS